MKFSKQNNIVDSEEWANLKEENGLDGGFDKGGWTQQQKKNESMKQYYAKNKAQMLEWFKSYYKDNSEEIRERSRNYYWSHIDERREYARVMHLLKHKGSIKEDGPEQCYKYRKRTASAL